MNKKEIITSKTKYYYTFINFILKKFLYGLKIRKNEIYLFIDRIKILHSLILLKNNSILLIKSLVDIVVIDNLWTKKRFEINYVFWNIYYEYRLYIKTFTDDKLYSISNYYKSSIWLEREVWDMYGIKFLFHKGLRRILTDYGFKGYPLRKDFPLVGYIDLLYDDSKQTIKISPMELAQNLRFYKFENPWNKWYE